MVAEKCQFYYFGWGCCYSVHIENMKFSSIHQTMSLCTKVHIMAFVGHGDGLTTISWPKSWCRRACSHCPACRGDHTLRGDNAKAAAGASRDRPMCTIGDKGQSAQNVTDRYNVDDRLRLWLIEELGSRVGHLSPPVRLPPSGWRESSFSMCTYVHIILLICVVCAYLKQQICDTHTGEHCIWRLHNKWIWVK